MKPRLTALTVTGALSLATLAPAAARADGATSACVAAYEQGQVQRKDGKLTEARERLLVCAQASCSPVLRKQCTAWLAELEGEIPTAVLVARGPRGEDLVDVEVSVDGKALAGHLDGKAVPLDPGPHVFHFAFEGQARDVNVLVTQGEHERRVVADFRDPSAPHEGAASASGGGATEPAPIPLAVPVLACVSVASFGVFTVFALQGMSAKNDLDARQCKPSCPESDVDAARRDFHIADLGLGIGVASLAAAEIVLFTKGEVPAGDHATAVAVDAAPVRGGGTFGLRGTF